jgi:hypothetical protein
MDVGDSDIMHHAGKMGGNEDRVVSTDSWHCMSKSWLFILVLSPVKCEESLVYRACARK